MAFSVTVGASVFGADCKPRMGGRTSVPELQEFRLVQNYHFGGRWRRVVISRSGSGGFFSIRVLGGRRRGARTLWRMDGVYQGRYQFLPKGSSHPNRLRLLRYHAGDVNAFPTGYSREMYRWCGRRFVLESRREIGLPRREAQPDTPPTLRPSSGAGGAPSSRAERLFMKTTRD